MSAAPPDPPPRPPDPPPRGDVAKDATVEGAIGVTIRDKRLCLPGVVMRSRCPRCGAAYSEDFGLDGLRYPVVGKAFDVECYCPDEECDHKWSVKLRLDMTLSVVSPEVPS